MKQDVYCPQRLKDGRYIVYKLKSFLGIKWWTPIPSIYVQLDDYLDEREQLESRLKVVRDLIKTEEKKINSFIEASPNSFNSFYGSSKRKYANVVAGEHDIRKEIVVTEKHIIPNDVIVCGIGDHKPSSNQNNQQQHNKPKS